MLVNTLKMSSFPLRFSRLYSSVAKNQLAALRRKTGFPISKCKEALLVKTGDLEAAENWLYSQAQSEGWAKVEKLRDRTANQGLIGLLIRGNRGAMVEVSVVYRGQCVDIFYLLLLQVNCETDFVAKNANFQSLVSTATQTLFDQKTSELPGQTSPPLTVFTSGELTKLETRQDSKLLSLGDAVAASVGLLGENLVLQRGCVLRSSSEGVLCGEVYKNSLPGGGVAVGKYATLLHLTPTEGSFGDREAIEKLGRDLSQHIIGINPAVINEGDSGISDPSKVLTQQNFVLDEDVKVGDMLDKCGARVTEFVRYALGEH